MTEDSYLLAGEHSELERLQLQSRVWEPAGGRGRVWSPGCSGSKRWGAPAPPILSRSLSGDQPPGSSLASNTRTRLLRRLQSMIERSRTTISAERMVSPRPGSAISR